MNTRVEISIKTVLTALAILAGAWLVVQIRDILFLLFIAFLLMTAIYPMVLLLERVRLPRIVAILIIYALLFGFFGVSIASAVPALVVQTNKLIQVLPDFVSRVLPYAQIDFNTISQQIAPLGENIVRVTVGIFSNILTIVTVLVFTFYFLLERRRTEEMLTDLLGESMGKRVTNILRSIERRLGMWVRGQLLLMLFVGVLVYVGLTVLRVDFALPLAILAGVLEIVPVIGPNVAAVPGVLVALGTSPFLALSTAALYFIVQQIENNILVPIIMKRSVGFAPIVTILVLMIGGRLAGITGVILSVPVALVAQEVVNDLLIAPRDGGKTKNPPARK